MKYFVTGATGLIGSHLFFFQQKTAYEMRPVRTLQAAARERPLMAGLVIGGLVFLVGGLVVWGRRSNA